jgi:hypothetical protein
MHDRRCLYPPSFKAKTRLASATLKYEETAHPRDLTFSKNAYFYLNIKWRFILLGVVLGWAQQLQCYTVGNSDLPGNAILSIYVDGSDTAWIGTDNGLTWYAKGTFRSNAVAGAKWVSECTKVPNGAVWCAFYNLAADGGVFRYHNGRLTWYAKNDIAPSYTISWHRLSF